MFTCIALICKENLSADSPVSANKPEARGGARRTTSGSSHDHSDEEDAETEAGQSEMTNDPNDLKRIRRCVVKHSERERHIEGDHHFLPFFVM